MVGYGAGIIEERIKLEGVLYRLIELDIFALLEV